MKRKIQTRAERLRRQRARRRAYYHANKEAEQQRTRAWKKKRAKYYRTQQRKYNRLWREENKTWLKKYVAANRKRINALQRIRYHKDPEKFIEATRRWRANRYRGKVK